MSIKMDDSWEKVNKIVIFGYGRQARRILNKLDKDFDIVAVVDNSEKVIGTEWKKGKYVRKTEDILEQFHDVKIIVCLMGKNYESVSKQLEIMGFDEGKDYIKCEEFITDWYLRYRNELCIMSMDVLTTTYCNLKCQGCAAFVPYIKNARHITCNEIVRSLDSFFRVCDYCFSMMLYGGEPLLNPNLPHILDEITRRYSPKIGYLGIITNGCCKLNGNVLESIIRNKVSISISDYSDMSGYEEKVEDFCSVLKSNNIDFNRNINMEWRNLGFPKEQIKLFPIEGQTHKESCGQVCHAVVNGKIYYCATAAVAEESKLFPRCKKDFYELDELINMPGAKYILQEFICGIDTDYKGFCDVCGGFGMDNPNIIKAGRQN